MSQFRAASTSSHVRQTFLNYFSGHTSQPHFIAKSTRVAPPTNDPTLPFVNAGMNAFKRVFLGQAKPPGCSANEEKRSVANSQKVRFTY
jgi:alanyl-tRNA synthetase